jgi:RecB family endonuclease NucS
LNKPLASERPFAREADLRDHIAYNLHLLEAGLCLHRRCPGSVEFCDGKENGKIDVVATDSLGGFLIIECKRDTADASALGQLLGYIAWFREWFQSFHGPVRGAIVAGKASPRLLRALRLVPDVPIMVFEVSSPHNVRRVA